MADDHITADTNLEDLLSRHPEVTWVFVRRRMLCFSCDLAKFESIGDACRIYGQPTNALLAELSAAINSKSSSSGTT